MIDSRDIRQFFKSVPWWASVLVFIVFVATVYGHVFSKGVSHADDAYIATGAKNLAFGYGYSSSITPDGSFGVSYFPAGFTTGPTLIVPASLLIRLFGNEPWVPGFTAATMNIILLTLIFFAIRKKIKTFQALTFFWLLFFLLYAVTAGKHFEQWFALLGEVPAALLSILGVLVLAGAPEKRSAILLSCLCFGLAFLAKMLSILGFLPVLGWLMVLVYRRRTDRRKAIVDCLLGVLVLLAPFILFDFYKLAVLGFGAYLRNYHDFFNALALWHDLRPVTLNEGQFSFFSLFTARYSAFGEHFGFSMASMFLVAALAGILIFTRPRDQYVNRLYILLLAGSFLHLFWWTCLSSGRPRYALIGLLLYFVAISCMVLGNSSRILKIMLIPMLVFVFTSSFKMLGAPVKYVIKHQYHYTQYVRNLSKTAGFLQSHSGNRPFIYTWWGTVADLEYALPASGNFKRIDFLEENDFHRDLILVRNSKWDKFYKSKQFEKQAGKFDDVLLDAPPFQVVRYQDLPTVLRTNDTIDFSESGNSGDFITYGWGLQEPGCRRTVGSHAGLSFKIAGSSGNDLVFRMDGSCMPGAVSGNGRRVNILFNNKRLGQWYVDNEKSYEVVIPSGVINDGSNKLSFDFPGPELPVACGDNSNAVLPGIAVKRITIGETEKATRVP